MLNRDEAVKIGKEHIGRIELPHPDYCLVLPDATETLEGWIFDYKVQYTKPGVPEKWGGGFGGAPAFIVLRKSGEVRNLTWRQFSELEATRMTVPSVPSQVSTDESGPKEGE